jgi:hypothetical protein
MGNLHPGPTVVFHFAVRLREHLWRLLGQDVEHSPARGCPQAPPEAPPNEPGPNWNGEGGNAAMKRGTPEHPKTLALMDVLKIPKYQAVGILEALWHWAAKYTPRGDIGRFTDADIARGIGWDKDATTLIAALTDCRWLDKSEQVRLVIHDWKGHADGGVQKYLSRNRLSVYEGNMSPTSPDKSRHVSPAVAPCPLPFAPCPLPLANNCPPALILKLPKIKAPPKGSAVFKKPNLEEIKAYCLERKNAVDAQMFRDFYESKGWLIGKNPMKNWHAAVRTWERRHPVLPMVPAQSSVQDDLAQLESMGFGNSPMAKSLRGEEPDDAEDKPNAQCEKQKTDKFGVELI